MNTTTRSTILFSTLAAFALGTAGACIIPDKGIIIEREGDCGELWGAQTIGAYGYNGVGDTEDIKTEDDEWVSIQYCLTPDQAAEAGTPGSSINMQLYNEVVAACIDRANNGLGIADNDQTCTTTAAVVHFGACSLPSSECDEGDTGGGSTSGDGDGDGDGSILLLSSLTLSNEVSYSLGARTVSQDLIDAVSQDSAGVLADGTRASQLQDTAGTPYAFEMSGVTSSNLGGVLGFVNGDEVTEVSVTDDGDTVTHPAASYDDLMAILTDLYPADSATVTLTRQGRTKVLRFARGT